MAIDLRPYEISGLGQSRTSSPTSNILATQTKNTAWGLLAGYQFTRNWGAEIFYDTNVGRFDGRNAAGTVSATGKPDAYGVVAVGTLPLSDAFSVYGKLGIANTRTSVSTSAPSTFASATRTDATYGLGGEYNATPLFGIRLGWERFRGNTTGGSGTIGVKDKWDVDLYSLAAVLKY